MLRRIALAITLITGSLQADAATPWDVPECEDSNREDDLALHPDGTIASWGLMRLVLPDLEDDVGGPEWIETPVRAGSPGKLTLGTLGGRAVEGPEGEALGVVRGCLVNPATGRVLALDVDLGPALGGDAQRVALPWSSLEIFGGRIRYRGDDGWIRSAQGIDTGF